MPAAPRSEANGEASKPESVMILKSLFAGSVNKFAAIRLSDVPALEWPSPLELDCQVVKSTGVPPDEVPQSIKLSATAPVPTNKLWSEVIGLVEDWLPAAKWLPLPPLRLLKKILFFSVTESVLPVERLKAQVLLLVAVPPIKTVL